MLLTPPFLFQLNSQTSILFPAPRSFWGHLRWSTWEATASGSSIVGLILERGQSLVSLVLDTWPWLKGWNPQHGTLVNGIDYPPPDDSMEAPKGTPLEDLVPFTEAFWELPR